MIKVTCDESNNSQEDIDNNKVNADIHIDTKIDWLKLHKSHSNEFIKLCDYLKDRMDKGLAISTHDVISFTRYRIFLNKLFWSLILKWEPYMVITGQWNCSNLQRLNIARRLEQQSQLLWEKANTDT
jgi:hypothetical protein